MNIRIRSRIKIQVLMTKIFTNLLMKKIQFFRSKIAILLTLGLRKGRPSYNRRLQTSKENTQYFKTWNFFTFFPFRGLFLPSLFRIQPTNINADPNGSGSTTLPQAMYTIGLHRYCRITERAAYMTVSLTLTLRLSTGFHMGFQLFHTCTPIVNQVVWHIQIYTEYVLNNFRKHKI